jgi:hypothetical protein
MPSKTQSGLALTEIRNTIRELRELGFRKSLFRAKWEVLNRIPASSGSVPFVPEAVLSSGQTLLDQLPFTDTATTRHAVQDLLTDKELQSLHHKAEYAAEGKIFSFSRWFADFGTPLQWSRDPWTGRRWPEETGWARSARQAGVGDVKLVWELGRFPHAYHLARVATFFPQEKNLWAEVFRAHVLSFVECNPYGKGIHWASGQEIVFRMMSWLFAAKTLFESSDPVHRIIAHQMFLCGDYLEEHIDYARFAVYNNHLLAEALGLFVAGVLLGDSPRVRSWRDRGLKLLMEQSERQFYADGSYIQQSHTYHRTAIQILIWAVLFCRSAELGVPREILHALDRSVTFLFAHQNPADGTLPNYGANDGGLPGLYTSCDFTDFRPTLQAASLLARSERLYPPGPWDEEAAWLLGPAALKVPVKLLRRSSVSFGGGHHVLRVQGSDSFSTFRCGTLRDRFSQMDMLHLDVWWRGMNVLADGGSYLYNGPQEWHRHFVGTMSHNTVTVDGIDQMVHHRKFKLLYPTEAAVLEFSAGSDWALATGEHYGFQRRLDGCTHRRSILMFGGDVWIVADTVFGSGEHRVRLHWLTGGYPTSELAESIAIETPGGRFVIAATDVTGRPLPITSRSGDTAPLRGWLSRYYGEKERVASIDVEEVVELPYTMISILGQEPDALVVDSERWRLSYPSATVGFRLSEGRIMSVTVGDIDSQ